MIVEIEKGQLIWLRWPGSANGKNARLARFVRYTKSGVVAQMANVSTKGDVIPGFGSDRSFPASDVVEIGNEVAP